MLLVHLVKLVAARPRPLAASLHDAFFQIHGLKEAIHSSFPSSHAVDMMVGAAFVGLLARSRVAILLALAAAVLMAAARVLIGKHYLSDVLAGWRWAQRSQPSSCASSCSRAGTCLIPPRRAERARRQRSGPGPFNVGSSAAPPRRRYR